MTFATEKARILQPPTALIEGDELSRIGQLTRNELARALKYLYNGEAGVLTGLTASATGADRVVTVAAGDGIEANGLPIIVPSSVPPGGNTPAATLDAGDATHPRIDVVYLQAAEIDGDTASTPTKATRQAAITNQDLPHSKLYHFTIGVAEGTPAASPVAPSIPAGACEICQVAVAAGATTINNGNITDTRNILPYIQTPTPASPSPRVVSFSTSGGSKAAITTARSAFAHAVSGTSFYAIGGRLSSGVSDVQTHNQAYDTLTNTWSTKTALGTARREVRQSAAINGKIYVIGGWFSGSGNLGTNDEYDTVANTWASKTAHPASASPSAPNVAYNGKIYVFNSNRTDEYDPATNTWAAKAVPPADRTYGSACLINGKIYITGGGSSTLSEYDPVANTWAAKTAPTNSRTMTQGDALGGKFYLVSGFTGSGMTTGVDAYDPVTNTWSAKSAAAVARRDAGVCVVGSTLYYFAGSDQGQSTYYTNHDAYQEPITETALSAGLATTRTSGVTFANTTSGLSGASIALKTGDVWGVSGAAAWTASTAEAIAIGGD